VAGSTVRAQGAGVLVRAARAVRAAAAPLHALEGQRGHLFPWVPVCLGTGIGLWFALPVEPGRDLYLALAGLVLAGLAAALRGPEALRPLAMALALVALGVLLAGWRGHAVAAPVIDFRFHGAIEGRVVELDRSLSDKPRLTLDRVVLEGVAPQETPARVRVSLHGRAEGDVVPTGATVILTGHLSPPQGPAEPGGFDFRRSAWFERLGAVGYTRTPVLILDDAAPGLGAMAIARLRRTISDGVQAAIPGDPGAFAAAVLTGDRSGIGRKTTDDLRNSSLAHLLAISGLHMALLTGVVFGAVRAGVALVPPLALRVNAKKLAAVVALIAATFYLALSGGQTPTVRAYVMATVMLVAVLCDRRALSLRAIAMAALIILAMTPEALTQPGFQMSFGATVALIVAFRALDGQATARGLPRWTAPVVSLFLSSLIAGVATAPLGAAHFNRVADYSILANMLSVPVMGSVVMPSAVAAAVLWPVGLHGPALWVMEMGNRWILWVAGWVAGLPGAVTYLPAAPPAFLPVFALGALWLVLWQGRARWAGLAPMAAALVLWAQVERPALLVADSGGLIGVATPEGRALSKATGDGFAARSWLEDDGDAALPAAAAARGGFAGAGGVLAAKLGATEVVQIAGRGWEARLTAECRPGRILVIARRIAGPLPGGCALLDLATLEKTGALAGWLRPDGALALVSVADTAGRRLWTGHDGGRPFDLSGDGPGR
jgi:competence protein ComEC